MGVRSAVRMWTVNLSHEDMDLLIGGRAVEKVIPAAGPQEGTLVLMMDQEGRIHLTYVEGSTQTF